jgi:hypothetical protein
MHHKLVCILSKVYIAFPDGIIPMLNSLVVVTGLAVLESELGVRVAEGGSNISIARLVLPRTD